MAVLRSRQKPQAAVVNPFDTTKLKDQFPPGVGGSVGASLAQDGALVDTAGWASAGYADYALSEGVAFLGYPYLASLAQRAEYRRMVEVLSTEMTRKWIKFTAEGEEDKSDRIKAIEDAFERLNVRDVFRKAVEHDGFFGRAHIFLSLEGDDQTNERATPIGDGRDSVSLAKIQKGSLQRLHVVEPYWIAANPIGFNAMDPLAADFYRPSNWNVMGRQVHASRLLTFVGRPVPDVLKPAYAFGGLSLTQMAKPYVDNWIKTRESVSDLISSFSVRGVKGMALLDAFATGEMEDLFNRIEVFNNLADNRGFFALGENEEFFNVSTQLGTLDKLQAQSLEQVCVVAGQPLVKYTGVAPSGLNASSDGEIRVWYDNVHSFQERIFAPNLKRLLPIVMLSEFGEVDDTIGFEFEPLWQMDDAQKAEIAVKRTQAIMLAEPVLSPSVVIRELREIGSSTGVFTQITDQDVDEAELEAPHPEEPLAGEADQNSSGSGRLMPRLPRI